MVSHERPSNWPTLGQHPALRHPAAGFGQQPRHRSKSPKFGDAVLCPIGHTSLGGKPTHLRSQKIGHKACSNMIETSTVVNILQKQETQKIQKSLATCILLHLSLFLLYIYMFPYPQICTIASTPMQPSNFFGAWIQGNLVPLTRH